MGKAPPANPSSPATPKKSSKVNTFKSHQNLSFNSKGWRSRRCEQWAVSSKWEKSKCCCSYSGKRLQRCGWGQNVSFCSENVHNSQHCGVIAGTLSLRHSARSGTYCLLIRLTKPYLLAQPPVLIRRKSMASTKWRRLKSLISWTQASKRRRCFFLQEILPVLTFVLFNSQETLARLLEEAKALKTKWSTVGR